MRIIDPREQHAGRAALLERDAARARAKEAERLALAKRDRDAEHKAVRVATKATLRSLRNSRRKADG